MKCSNDKCTNNANPDLGSGKFCCRSCANSRIRTKEIKQKISKSVKRGWKARPPLSENVLQKWKQSIKQSWEDKYKAKSFEELSVWQKRRRVIDEQEGKCADCGLAEWNSMPIALEIDHKDGNTNNNSRENLWGLCPNCHSTTETWRGKNKNKTTPTGGKLRTKKVSDKQLADALRTTSTIRQALLEVGLTAKGGNYQRAKELKSIIT